MPKKPKSALFVVRGARWSIDIAAVELAVDDRTLNRKLVDAGIRPGDDGRYSTLDIFRALAGDRHAEKRRKEKNEADRIQIENEQTAGALIPTTAAVAFVEGLAERVRKVITSNRRLTAGEKNEIFAVLAACSVGDIVPAILQSGD